MKNSNYVICQILHFLTLIILYFREMMLLLGNNPSFVSNLFYIFIVLCTIWMFVQSFILRKEHNRERLRVGLVYIVFSFLIIVTTYNTQAMVDAQTNEAIGELIILLVFYGLYTNKRPFSMSMIKINTILNILFAILLFIKSFSSASYFRGDLVFNYLNPNSTGLVALITAFCIIVGIRVFTDPIFSILGYTTAIMSLYVCIKSRSRSAIIVFFVFLIIVLYKRWKIKHNVGNIRLNDKFLICVQFFALLYPFLWSIVYTVIPNQNIQILGKPLFSNRELIWAHMFSVFSKEPFRTHLGESFVYGTGPHNVFMSIWWAYGIIAVICFNMILYKLYKQLNGRVSSYTDMLIVICLVSLLCSMSFEALLFSGGLNFTFRIFYLGFYVGNDCGNKI